MIVPEPVACEAKDEMQQVIVYVKMPNAGYWTRTLFFNAVELARLEANFLDFQRDGIGHSGGYDCESALEGTTDRIPTRLMINIAQVAFIA